MPTALYLDAARMGRMVPSAQWALHDFVRLAGEEGCTLYFEQFLKSGFVTLPNQIQSRYPGLRCWGGLAELKAALAELAGLPVHYRPLIAGRSAKLMTLAAKLLFQKGRRILVTDFTWHSYGKILEREAKKSAAKIERVPIRAGILRDAVSGDELTSRIVRTFLAAKCDGLFLPDISHDGIRLPTTEIVAAIRERAPASFLAVDGSQAFGHVPLKLAGIPCDFYLTGCHKWLGSHLPLGVGFFANAATRDALLRQSAELLECGRLDDPLLAFVHSIESGHLRRFTETVNLSPLFSCRGALEDHLKESATDCLKRRLANAGLARRIARMTLWKPLIAAEEFQSASVLLQCTSAVVRAHEPGYLRSMFHDYGIALTTYANGIVRLAMPSVPLWNPQAGALIHALAMVPPRASRPSPSAQMA